MAPQDISAGMLRRQPHNLNEQSFDATVLLIQGVLDSGVDVTQIFVDTVGDPKTYAAKLQRAFPRHGHIEWTVARKADATYPIVGAASIAAKVTRDACIDRWLYAEPTLPYDGAVQAGKRKREEEDEDAASTLWETGSGYPGDPKTVRYLRETLDPIFGWAGIVRFSWATAKSLLEEPYTHKDPSATSLFGTPYPTSTRAYKVHWIDEAAKEAKQSTLKGFFTRKPTARTFATAATDTSAVAEASGGSEMQQVMRHDRKALQEQRPEAWHRMALTSCSATDFL
ncbi:RNA-DNA hybrid ribonuclease [Malassezia pachydermatis]